MKLSGEDVELLAKYSFSPIGHNNRFSGLDALLVWQYVRFNKKYRSDYTTLIKNLGDNSENEDHRDFLVQAFCSHWSLSEPIDFNIEKVSEQFFFEFKLVRKIKDLARESLVFDFNSDPFQSEIFLAINTQADKRIVMKEVERYLGDEVSSIDTIRPNNLAHLSDNFFCFYLKEVLSLSNVEVKRRYDRVFAGELQDKQMSDKINSFHSVAAKSPWCFLAAPQ